MDLVIRARNGPGKRCVTDGARDNVHVGLQRGKEPVELRSGGVKQTEWRVAVDVIDTSAGIDFRGPYVQGRRGDRFVYLTWGDVGGDGSFAMFRRAKLKISQVDQTLLTAARAADRALVATVDLTGADGGPVCGTPGPDRLQWSAE